MHLLPSQEAGFRAYKAEVGIFFANRKQDKIRMIVGCRQANFCHQTPPRTRPRSAGALSELDLQDVAVLSAGQQGLVEIDVRGSAAGVDNSFYQLLAPEVASCFAVRRKVRARGWGCQWIWGDTVQRCADLGHDEMVYPVFEALPMGWAWALRYCEAVTFDLARTCGFLEERTAAHQPLLGAPAVGVGVDVDDVYVVGVRHGESSG